MIYWEETGGAEALGLELMSRSEWVTETMGSRKVWKDVIPENLEGSGGLKW